MNVLVVGGAGYIGSHILKELESTDHRVFIYDNISTGHIKAIPKKFELIIADIANQKKLIKILRKKKIDVVIHLATHRDVRDSLKNPGKYFRDNINNTLNLLDAMHQADVDRIIYPSTGLVYGKPKKAILPETYPIDPNDPYSEASVAIEAILDSYSKAYGINYCIFRLFNVSGAHQSGDLGENLQHTTRIIPSVLKVALNESDAIEVYGNKHKTKDGFAIRDYIHVSDVAKAFVLAIDKVHQNKIYNLGSGKGSSVKDIINIATDITLRKIPYDISPAKEGEVPKLIADISKVKRELKWEPEHNLKSIIETAWNWHSVHPKGFRR